ncbi:hypothetical protein GCM10011351_29330 [Paraliobacillus quinghaiensis]|uniref:Uncharacterized protein n=1 Tax=Paraliobacillus quinghaiensis TaxID=470815 RepID=A0A917TW29_9BACI|nr:hypothetical protein [Paraliobacillus quinghaiensis]GGM41274.1 hypothetical protein GCM10011351_29330 [Paraliobacillus quinghaiensis]
MKKFLVVILLVLIVAIGFIVIRFGNALFQEENTTEIIASITKLEFTNNDYIKVTDTSHGIRCVSKNKRGSQEKVIKEFMKDNEWQFKEQMGSGFVFTKDGVNVVVETRLFSRNYFLWDVPEEVFH